MASGPLLAIKGLPALVKVCFSLTLALAVWSVVGLEELSIPGGGWGYALAALSETAFGLLLGTAVTIILNSIRMAGQLIDFQIGYAMSNLIDPTTGASTTLLSQFLYMLGLVFFFVADGHHTLIVALVSSYQLVPLNAADFGGGAAKIFTQIFAGSVVMGLQVSAPILAVILVTDLALGFLTRTTPQINVFLTGFPVKITIGLLLLSFLIPLLGIVFNNIFNTIDESLYLLMKELI